VEWTDARSPHEVRKPLMLQRWESLTFLHWRYEPDTIRGLLPAKLEQQGLRLDTFDGAAWISLTPFRLTRLRPPFLPPAPWLSRFPETNVRTYVRGPDGKPGIWFFTLEAARLAAVIAARAGYGLPYRWSRMRVRGPGNTVQYQSRRLLGRGSTRISIEPGESFGAAQLDNFLTARYRLLTRVGNRLAYADIDHPPWPLQRARVLECNEDLIVNSGVPAPRGEPIVHFSRVLDVRIGRLRWF
jgi:uncharacterized protein